jgi:sugar phosphate isomerase/epimerase
MGRVDWQQVIKALYNIGYDWVLNIEHEDSNWEGSPERVGQGFLVAKSFLESYTV